MDVRIGIFDQLPQGSSIMSGVRTQFHMAHALASPLEQIRRIIQIRSAEESDVHMGLEYVHVPERQITRTGNRATIVDEFPDVRASSPHFTEPRTGDQSQFRRLRVQPCIDGRIPSGGRGEAEHAVDAGTSHTITEDQASP